MTKRDWVTRSTMAIMLSASLLMFADGGQAVFAATAQKADLTDTVETAYDLVGKPFKKNAEGPSAFDTAGYIQYVFSQQGVKLPDNIRDMYNKGTKINTANLKPGDVVFIKTSPSSSLLNYAGIYVGNDTFLYASVGQQKVIEQSLSTVKDKLAGVRRYIDLETEQPPAEKPADPPKDSGVAKPDKNSEASTLGQKIIKTGEKYLGTPYKFGAKTGNTSSFDCSSFTQYVMQQNGIKISRGARAQFKDGKKVDRKDLRVGDLIFFSTENNIKKYPAGSINRIGHVGIYAGNGKVLHTYGSGGVRYSSIEKGWWNDHYVTAARYF
ncbi:C40 family peptidase [Brevibacillus sp. B_LB10_24]|uniref:C40 family peptidase n=1 Tax=Brevibacillus sp. B_LB10_24 TaxID=3380645 RepID=UPI0038BDE78F